MPKLLLDKTIVGDNDGRISKGEEYVKMLGERIKAIQQGALVHQHIVIEKNKTNAETSRSIPVGELVLATPVHKGNKTSTKYEGPYKIVNHLSDTVYRLQSLINPDQLLEMHYARLIPFTLKSELSEEEKNKIARQLALTESGEYQVEAVIAHEGTNKKNIRFCIKWLGYPVSQNTWEPWHNVCKDNQLNDKVENYIVAHPELHRLLK